MSKYFIGALTVALLVASCSPKKNDNDTKEKGGQSESIFSKNGIKPALEKELLRIFEEDIFGGWPVYMVIICANDKSDYLFVVGSDSFLRKNIIGGFFFDKILLTFYSNNSKSLSKFEIMSPLRKVGATFLID